MSTLEQLRASRVQAPTSAGTWWVVYSVVMAGGTWHRKSGPYNTHDEAEANFKDITGYEYVTGASITDAPDPKYTGIKWNLASIRTSRARVPSREPQRHYDSPCSSASHLQKTSCAMWAPLGTMSVTSDLLTGSIVRLNICCTSGECCD